MIASNDVQSFCFFSLEMKSFLFVFACFVGLSTVSCQLNREYIARRAARQCVREQKIKYEVAYKFSKGEFSDDSPEAKCFLKCLAYKLKFFNDAGVFQKEELLTYTKYLVPDSIPSREIFDECEATIVKAEDECDYVYRAYKCFWDGVRITESIVREGNTLRFSLYDVLDFSRLANEEEDLEVKQFV